MPAYYAIEHTYGANNGDRNGNHIGEVVAFESRQARDQWVNNRLTDDQDRPGYREALRYRERADRHAIRRFRQERERNGR